MPAGEGAHAEIDPRWAFVGRHDRGEQAVHLAEKLRCDGTGPRRESGPPGYHGGMARDWDAIVVGCGPAGSSAARVIAGAGYQVLVLDRKRVVGEPNHCGEAVSADCLREAGVSPPQPWIRQKVSGCRIVFPNRCVIHFPREGYSLDRPAFDRCLAERARAAGARIRTGVWVRGLESTAEGWRVGTGGGPVTAGYLVGAGGALCPVAHAVGQRAPCIPAVQYKLPLEAVPRGVVDGWLLFYQHEMLRGAYGWLFPRNGEVALGAGGRSAARRGLDFLCRSLGIDQRRTHRVSGGPIPFLDRVLRLSHPRAVLCGDAGGFIHPLTKGGVHGAVWSGRLAGEAVVAALGGNMGALSEYEEAVREYPSRELRQLRRPHALFRFDNAILEMVGRVMDDRHYADTPVGRVLRELLRRPRLRTLWGIAVAAGVQHDYRRSERFTW